VGEELPVAKAISPTQALQVSGRVQAHSFGVTDATSSYAATGSVYAFLFRSLGGSGTYPFNTAGTHALVIQGASSGSQGDIAFATGNSSPTIKMVIQKDGKIGVGNAGAAPDSVRSIYANYNHVEFSGSSMYGLDVSIGGFRTGSSHGSGLTGIFADVHPTSSNNQNWTGEIGLIAYEAFVRTTGGSGEINGSVGFHMSNPDQSGVTFKHLYGVRIDHLTRGTSSNYSLYTGSAKGHFGGDLNYVGTLTNTSDARIKTNVQTISSALSKVAQMRGVSYARLDGTKESSVGLIAQELEAIAPELVKTGNEVETVIINEGTATEATITEVKSINYSHLVAYLIEAIKELNAKVTVLEG